MKSIAFLLVLLCLFELYSSIQLENSLMGHIQRRKHRKSRAKKSKFVVREGEDLNKIVNSCIAGLLKAIPPEFCWKKGGDFGRIPTDCPASHPERHAALCFEKCRDTHEHFLGVCYKKCDPGYNPHGFMCTAQEGLGFTFRASYVPGSKTNFEAVCSAGEYLQGALCYKDCKTLVSGKEMVNCGIGACSRDKKTCTKEVLKITWETVKGVGEIVANIVTLGGASAAKIGMDFVEKAVETVGKDAAQMMFYQVKDWVKGNKASLRTQGLKDALEEAKKLGIDDAELVRSVCDKVDEDVINKFDASQGALDRAFQLFDHHFAHDVVAKCKKGSPTFSGVECARSVLENVALFDPTGFVGLAANFVYPHCEDVRRW